MTPISGRGQRGKRVCGGPRGAGDAVSSLPGGRVGAVAACPGDTCGWDFSARVRASDAGISGELKARTASLTQHHQGGSQRRRVL